MSATADHIAAGTRLLGVFPDGGAIGRMLKVSIAHDRRLSPRVSVEFTLREGFNAAAAWKPALPDALTSGEITGLASVLATVYGEAARLIGGNTALTFEVRSHDEGAALVHALVAAGALGAELHENIVLAVVPPGPADAMPAKMAPGAN